MKIKKPKIEEKKQAKYDSSLLYQWNGEQSFPLMGVEFEYMFKTTSDFLNLPSSQHILRIMEMHRILESKLKEGVENGAVIAQ